MYHQKGKSKDQEPLLKIYCSCFPLSRHYVDEEDAFCEVEMSIPTDSLDKYR